ncbi:MAG: hypothetical protein Q8L35_08295, partial [Actinomycetota bacterium]|nr:hypothetical protein [Actinomycetota bacterium]
VTLNRYLEITHAAREGVRWAALRAPISEVETKAKDAAPGIDWTQEATITVAGVPVGGATDANQGNPVTVTITYDNSDMGLLAGFDIFLPTTISSSATQRVE